MKKQITIEKFLDFQYLSNPKIAVDGKTAAFVVTRADEIQNQYFSDLWLLNLQTGEKSRGTNAGNVRQYYWTKDGWILYQTSENGKTVFFQLNPDTGRSEKVFSVPFSVNDLVFLEDNRYLLYGVYDRRQGTEARESEAYEIFEETPFWFNGSGIIDGRRRALYLYDPQQDTCEKISGAYSDVAYYDVRGNRLVYTAYSWKNLMKDPFKPAVILRDLKSGEEKTVFAQDQQPLFRVAFWKENEILLTGSPFELTDGEGEPSNFYTLNLETGKIELFVELGYSLGMNTICSDARYGFGTTSKRTKEDAYAFLLTLGEDATVCRLEQTGELLHDIAKLQGVHTSVDSFDVYEDHTLTCEMRSGCLAEIYYDGRKMTDFNDAFVEEYEIIEPRFHSFMASDGFEVHGYALRPAGWQEGKKYPAILHVHGGPLGAFGEVYHHEMQMWANAGYYVLYCNPRGSDGRGKDYTIIHGLWGNVDYQNIMDFTDEMLRCYPDIDIDRMGICGGSYGGYMTNWVIGHTNRFAAAASLRSISFLNSFEYVSDIGLMCTETENRATTDTNPGKLWNQSPLKYARYCTTPTLFVQSDEDYRCYMTDAISMFTALKKHGCTARMCLFHGENHELSRSGKPQNRIIRMKEILDWFERYLKAEK